MLLRRCKASITSMDVPFPGPLPAGKGFLPGALGALYLPEGRRGRSFPSLAPPGKPRGKALAPRPYQDSPLEEKKPGVNQGRGGEQEAVQAVQEAAVAGEEGACVLHRGLAFQHGLKQIPQHPDEAEDKGEEA